MDGRSVESGLTGRMIPGSDWSSLMARAQNGDRVAYAALLEQLAPYLRSVSRRYFRADDDVDDSLQDILLTVHTIRHTYDPRRPFGPWILAIAKHRIADRLRRRLRVNAKEVSLWDHGAAMRVPAPGQVDAGLDRTWLYRAIGGLPLAQRRAIELLRLRELSLREASAETGVTPGALKVALHRALDSLRQTFAAR